LLRRRMHACLPAGRKSPGSSQRRLSRVYVPRLLRPAAFGGVARKDDSGAKTMLVLFIFSFFFS
jgi:hypothetical protein